MKSSQFLESKEWKILRYETLRAYGYQCMACGSKPPNVILHVDHIKPRFNFPELALCPSNLQVLCADCNLGKGARYWEDLRPKETQSQDRTAAQAT